MTDNSIHFFASFVDSHFNGYYETPSEVYDRNFTMFNKSKSIKLSDILTVHEDPFYFEIVNPENKDQVLLSTKDQAVFQKYTMSLMNLVLPAGEKDRVFGLGERNRNNFFLFDQTTYAMYNNDNNVERLI